VAGMSIWVLVVGPKNQEIDNLMLNYNPFRHIIKIYTLSSMTKAFNTLPPTKKKEFFLWVFPPQ
jgi:hypothetical protein